jgi:hypothetical protein
MKSLYLIICFLLIFSTVWSQSTAQFEWNYHLSNIHTFDVVQGNNKIYFLSDGGIYYFNESDNSIETLTKIDGLSGSDFQGITPIPTAWWLPTKIQWLMLFHPMAPFSPSPI